MNLRLLKMSALALASFASSAVLSVSPAAAAGQTVTFKFDQMGGSSYTASGQNASSSQISNYMTQQLHDQTTYDAGYNINVSGGIGQQGASSYTGDNHVVGPVVDMVAGPGGNTVFPLTLANTDNGVKDAYYGSGVPVLTNLNTDGFIKNCTHIDPSTYSSGAKGCVADSSDIFINFNTLKIYSFSFDFEIFPDATCASMSNCPSLPDIQIWSGDNKSGVHFATFTGIEPNKGVNPITCLSVGTSDPNYTQTYQQSGGGKYDSSGNPIYTSPVNETAPQLLCHASYTVSDFKNAAGFPVGGITSLDFVDWPETIGIDNLTVTVGTPEPATLGLLALGIVGLLAVRRRRARSARRLAIPV